MFLVFCKSLNFHLFDTAYMKKATICLFNDILIFKLMYIINSFACTYNWLSRDKFPLDRLHVVMLHPFSLCVYNMSTKTVVHLSAKVVCNMR